jgi:acetylornithine/succinyldiaminopimelate/putrescine aminotransferase
MTCCWCSTRCSAASRRSGTFYAYEQYGIVPDMVATAKGIGGGFPLGACLATEKAARGMVIGTHGSTYGGNPLAMAAGEAVLDAVANLEFLADVRAKSEQACAAASNSSSATIPTCSNWCGAWA